MWVKKRSQACLTASGTATLVVLLMVLYGTMNSRQPGGLRQDHRLQGPLYKLDPSWPGNPELFGGEVFGVAVDHVHHLVYVAQRGEHTDIHLTHPGMFL